MCDTKNINDKIEQNFFPASTETYITALILIS